MGLLNKIKQALNPAKNEPDTCASSYPDWEPSKTWTPDFDDNGATPEAYDGN
jgi:hypothetical protein